MSTTYTTRVYDDLRRLGWTARDALRVARYDHLAEVAGVDGFPCYAVPEPVVIDGREYRLTVEPEPEGWRYGDDDVTGRIVERARRRYTGWPAAIFDGRMVALDEHRAYEPGGCYDHAEHLAWKRRQGMARHAAWLAVRADLLREAEPYVRELDYGEPRNWIVTLTDADGRSESLCGVGLGYDAFDRGTVYGVAQDLASELVYESIVAAMKVGEALSAATCHG